MARTYPVMIPLTGLSGAHPLGAMAAFGLLRVASFSFGPDECALSWSRSGGWRPILHLSEAMDGPGLIRRIAKALVDSFDEELFGWGEEIKVPPGEFADQLRATLETASSQNREAIDFLAAFGSEMVRAKNKDLIKTPAFYLVAGQQKFLSSIQALGIELSGKGKGKKRPAPGAGGRTETAFQEALFGPWRYQDEVHSLGWDPATERLHALQGTAPTSQKPKSVRAAVWLGVQSLPLFPSFPVGRFLWTRGFDRMRHHFTWPLWGRPIGVRVLKSLLGTPEIHQESPSRSRLQARGIEALFCCDREEDANGRGVFRPAYQIC